MIPMDMVIMYLDINMILVPILLASLIVMEPLGVWIKTLTDGQILRMYFHMIPVNGLIGMVMVLVMN